MSIWLNMWDAFKDIVRAPFVDWSVMWLLAPVLLLWFILEIYFDTHKKEKLGWNTSLGNAISMFWIGVTLMRFLFENKFENFSWYKLVVVSFMVLYALFIATIAFKHAFSAKITFLLASPTPVYYLSAIAVLWTYGSLQPTWWTFLNLLILFPTVIGIERLVRHFLPESKRDEEEEPRFEDKGLQKSPADEFGGSGDEGLKL